LIRTGYDGTIGHDRQKRSEMDLHMDTCQSYITVKDAARQCGVPVRTFVKEVLPKAGASIVRLRVLPTTEVVRLRQFVESGVAQTAQASLSAELQRPVAVADPVAG
jgi:hypothetical protein